MTFLDRLRAAVITAARGTKSCPHCPTALPLAARYCYMCGRELAADSPPRVSKERLTPIGADDYQELRDRLTEAVHGRYLVHDLLGAGAMGAVFLADDLELERRVAIKVLPLEVTGDAGIVERFRREAKTAARLDHPHIIPVYAVESRKALHWFVMKYVAGRSLESVLEETGPLPLPFALRVLREAATALAHAHKHGVVHRDVKPANIMLDADDRVVITDFGISKIGAGLASGDATVQQLTSAGTALGTPHYIAPEQALGHTVDGRADQYALAIVGYRMLTGEVPFDGDSPHAIVHQHITSPVPRVASKRQDVPVHVVSALARATAKAPSNRFPTVQEFAVALDGRLEASETVALDAADMVTAKVSTASSAAVAGNGGRRRGARRFALVVALLLGLASIGAVSKLAGIPAQVAGDTTAIAQPAAAPITIVSSPSATVYIDGARIGETPLANHQLPIGEMYRIRVEKAGYRTKRDSLRVRDATPISRRYILSRSAGK